MKNSSIPKQSRFPPSFPLTTYHSNAAVDRGRPCPPEKSCAVSKRIEALEAELEDERRFRRSAQQAARDAISMSTAPPTPRCAAEDDNLMDVGCQTEIKANGAAGGNDAALRARCDTLSIENGALERKLSSVEEELRQLQSDNKVCSSLPLSSLSPPLPPPPAAPSSLLCITPVALRALKRRRLRRCCGRSKRPPRRCERRMRG